MKDLLQQYAAHNKWANQQILDIASQLTTEQINQEIISSFSSVQKTVLHLLDAESIWWQRMKLKEQVEVPSKTFTASFDELKEKLLEQSKAWEEWVANATEPQLLHVFAFVREKEQLKNSIYHMLLHLFNHGTYHRGQLITMYRQLGIAKLPSTDFMTYVRKVKS